MPGFLVHVGATLMCPHGGMVQAIPSSPRVLVGGQPVVTAGDTFVVAGCPLNVAGAPHPCLTVQWLVPATRVLAGGKPVILQSSTGLCQAGDQAPQGPPLVVSTQPRVGGM